MVKQTIRFLGGIYLTIGLLLALFLLILFATFAQVDHGIFEANKRYFTSWFVWLNNTPIFLGGYTIGTLLMVNLILSHATKFQLKWRYLGLFFIHFGLLLLIVGSGITSFYGKEMTIAIAENTQKNHLEFPSEFELVIIQPGPVTDTLHVYSLAEVKKGPLFKGIQITPEKIIPNSIINQRGIQSRRFHQLGAHYKLISLPKTYKMDERNVPGIELTLRGTSINHRFLLWGGSAIHQSFTYQGVHYLIKLRPKRTYLPFSIRLDDFSKVDYQGTQTAKRFVSQVTLITDTGHVPFTIEMNHPLRYGGYTFFQSSFTEDEGTSVFQVVKNPSWQIPYVASLLIVVGLFIQMILGMQRGRKS
ncbi:MAG: cytochrome c biogenesis protein ResB [Candidatus Marinamargulisbacteria bacterium]